MTVARRVFMALGVIGGIAVIVGVFLPWIGIGSYGYATEYISGWQIYNEFDIPLAFIILGGGGIAVIFGLLGVIFPKVGLLKGIALSGALVAAVIAGELYYGISQAGSDIGEYIGIAGLYVEAGYGLLVSLGASALSWLLSMVALL